MTQFVLEIELPVEWKVGGEKGGMRVVLMQLREFWWRRRPVCPVSKLMNCVEMLDNSRDCICVLTYKLAIVL
jgi:hypothetical protein